MFPVFCYTGPIEKVNCFSIADGFIKFSEFSVNGNVFLTSAPSNQNVLAIQQC